MGADLQVKKVQRKALPWEGWRKKGMCEVALRVANCEAGRDDVGAQRDEMIR